MERTTTVLLAGWIVLSCAVLASAQAMPTSDLATVSRAAATSTHTVVCRSYRCGWRPSYTYAPPVVIPRVYYGGCAPGWVGCWTYPYGWYRAPGSEGYYGWPYY
jgi:hypothetical protein